MTAPIIASIYIGLAFLVAELYLDLWIKKYLPDYDRLTSLPPVFTTITKLLVFILALVAAPLAAFDLVVHYLKKEDTQK